MKFVCYPRDSYHCNLDVEFVFQQYYEVHHWKYEYATLKVNSYGMFDFIVFHKRNTAEVTSDKQSQ